MEHKRRPSVVKISKPRHSLLIQEEVFSTKQDVVSHDELEGLWEELDSWSFDIFKVANKDLPKMAEKIFLNLGLLTTLPVDYQKLKAFIQCMVAQYRPHVPFHNFRHACDVLHAMYLFLKLGGAEDKLNDLEKLALCISALCHDVDHPGLTNSFLVACNDPLAIRYNDLSVLENHHASITIKALTGYESMNILGIFPDSEQRYIRKLIVSCILATDMSQHGAVVQSFIARSKDPDSFQPSPPYQYHPPPPPKQMSCNVTGIFEVEEQDAGPAVTSQPYTSSEDVLLLMKMIMKCSDISNTIRPFFLSKKWAALLLLEWFRQGDVERRLGMEVSRNMDRNDPDSLQTMTLGCIDTFSTPMYEAAARVLPKLQGNVIPNLVANREAWMSFSTAGPLEQEVQIILGSFFPVEREEGPHTTKSVRTSQLSQPSASEVTEPAAQRGSEAKKASVTTVASHSKDRPLSLLFGAPLGRDVSTLASELAWNTTLRDSSVRVNLVPSTRRSHSGSIGALQMGPLSAERGSSISGVEDFSRRETRPISLDDVAGQPPSGFFTRLRAGSMARMLSRVLDSRFWAYFVAIPATLIALFLNDFNRAFLPKSVDTFVEVVYLVCLFLFLIELVTLSILKPAYLFSFAFWLDLVGSLTLIPYMFGLIRQNLIVARVWKATETLSRLAKKLQSKSAKIPSAYLIARLAKAVFYHLIHPRESRTSDSKETTEESSDQFMSSKPSHLWLRLSDLQSQRLVLGILLLAIALPYFYQLPEDLAPTLALQALDTSPLNTLRFNTSLVNLNAFNEQHGYEITYLGCRDACAVGSCSGYEFAEGDPFIQVIPPPQPGVDAKAEVSAKYREEELVKVMSDSRRCEAFYSILIRCRRDHMLNVSSGD